jgi:hypothetical protein
LIVDPDAKTPAEPQKEKCEINESPVNFFEPDYSLYPLFEDIDRKYTVLLHEGDCVYIPAFYFHQYNAKPLNAPPRDGIKPSALAVILKYKSNSAMLSAFMSAVEMKILT